MPFIVAPLAAGIVAAGITTSIATATVIAQVIVTVVGLAVSIGISAISALLNKPKSPIGSNADREQTIRQPITVHRIIYGEIRVGGPITFLQTEKVWNAALKEYEFFLNIMITVAAHEVESIGAIYFADELIELDSNGNAIGKYAGHVTIKKGLGTTAGDADLLSWFTTVTNGEWTVNHKQEGCAKIAGRLKHDVDLFPNGLPNISGLIKGKKLYDPRTMTTAYSTNAILCALDYITNAKYGIGDPTYDTTLASASANVADEAVTVAGKSATFEIFHVTTPTQAPFGSGVWNPTRGQPASGWALSHNGTYKYAVTFTDDVGETLPGPEVTINVQGVPLAGLHVANIPKGPPGTTSRKLYRTDKNGSQLKLIATISDNTTTSFNDINVGGPITGGANAPVTETTQIQDDLRIPTENELNLLVTGLFVQLTTTGTLPSPLALATDYYVNVSINKTYFLATTKQNALDGIFINITDVGTGVHTMTFSSEIRYTCNGHVDTDTIPREVLGQLLSSCKGHALHQGGKWNLYAGSYIAPTITLTEDDFDGPIDVTWVQSKRNIFNGVKGIYTNPDENYQPTDYPAVTSAFHKTKDQEERIWEDLDLGYTLTPSMAQRLSKIHLLENRQEVSFKAKCKLKAVDTQAGENIMVTIPRYGWTNKIFRIKRWGLVGREDPNGPRIGVDIECQEIDSAIYDWDLGEEVTKDLTLNTTLADPFTVEPPGNPSIVEDVYETTGSAGVKARATITYGASQDSSVALYELAYRRLDLDDFTMLPPQSGLTVVLEDLQNAYYDFKVRAINQVGVHSPWSDIVRKEIKGLSDPPADITGFSVIAIGGVAEAHWDLHSSLDVRIGGDIIFRQTSKTSGVAWEDGSVISMASGSDTFKTMPLVAGTYMARAKDSTGHLSDNFVSFVVTESVILGYTVAATVTEAPGFTGSKTNTVVADSKLSIDDTSVSLTGNYDFAAAEDVSGGAAKKYRLELDIDSLAFNADDLLDSRGLIDDWADIDGGKVDGANVIVYFATTDDDPAGSPTWSAWTPFIVAEVTCRAVKFKVDLISDEEQNNIEISKLTVEIKELL